MLQQLTGRLDFLSDSLQLRAHRQQVLAGNIANADTAGYVARDFDFAKALQNAASNQSSVGTAGMAGSDGRHLRSYRSNGSLTDSVRLGYSVQTQPSLDGNSVDLDRERANFADNAIRYESTLRFINGHVKTMLSAIQGQ